MAARLVITTEEDVVIEVALSGQPVQIGRAGDSTVRTTDRRTSRHHAIIRPLKDGGYEVADAGSFNGTLLNGRPIQRERLGHRDHLVLGGLHVQYLEDFTAEEEVTVSESEEARKERLELRQHLQRLIEEAATLRQEIGKAREAQKLAERQRDEEHDEAVHLRERIAEQKGEIERLSARIDALGHELRNERSARAGGGDAGLQEKLQDAQKAADRQRARVLELEEQKAQIGLEAQKLKKEVERLQDVNQKHEKRTAELEKVVKPALVKVAQLTEEVDRLRLQLAQAQADLKKKS
jgi:pSer/pThr/pTyr-binding forkhead associated (FHA) protein